MTDNLIGPLLAAIEETERIARAATPGPWRHNPNKHGHKPRTSEFYEAVFAGLSGKDATCIADTGISDDPQSMADASHIAYNDPRTVLRHCAADRRVIERHQADAGLCKGCHYKIQHNNCPELNDLAEGYGIAIREDA